MIHKRTDGGHGAAPQISPGLTSLRFAHDVAGRSTDYEVTLAEEELGQSVIFTADRVHSVIGEEETITG